MIISKMDEKKRFSNRQDFCLMMALSVVLLLPFCTASLAMEEESVQSYKMISVVEYTGKGQFKNQVETLFTVRKQALSNNKVQYFVFGNDLNPNLAEESSLSKAFSFILDRNTRQMSGGTEDFAFWARVNNESVKSLKKVTKDNVGKTWKQSIDLSTLGESIPDKLKFTLTAMELKTKVFGEMMAVRALSEPFFIKAGKGFARSKTNAIYLFDPEIEDIYLSISVFEAATNANGFKETLRHEVATYRTDAEGASVDLSGLGKKFEQFVRKVGLSNRSLKIVKQVPLPQWAQSEGLAAAQAANICAAMVCEGAPNPVVTVCIPAARTVAMQSLGKIPSIGTFATAQTVAGSLAKSVPGIGTMKIAMAPAAFAGSGINTAAMVAGGTVGGAAVVGADEGDTSRSPFVP